MARPSEQQDADEPDFSVFHDGEICLPAPSELDPEEVSAQLSLAAQLGVAAATLSTGTAGGTTRLASAAVAASAGGEEPGGWHGGDEDMHGTSTETSDERHLADDSELLLALSSNIAAGMELWAAPLAETSGEFHSEKAASAAAHRQQRLCRAAWRAWRSGVRQVDNDVVVAVAGESLEAPLIVVKPASGRAAAVEPAGHHGRGASVGDCLGAAYFACVLRCPKLFLCSYTVLVSILLLVAGLRLDVDVRLDDLDRSDGPAMMNHVAFESALAWQAEMRGTGRDTTCGVQLGLSAANSSHGACAGNDADERFALTKVLRIYYTAKHGAVFDERILRDIRDFEGRLRSSPRWRGLCSETRVRANESWRCNPGDTLAAYAWPSHSNATAAAVQLRFDALGQEMLAAPAFLGHFANQLRQGHALSSRILPRGYVLPSVAQLRSGLAAPPSLRSTFAFVLDRGTVHDAPGDIDVRSASLAAEFEQMVEHEVYPLLAQASSQLQHVAVHFDGDGVAEYEVKSALLSAGVWSIGSASLIVIVTLLGLSRSSVHGASGRVSSFVLSLASGTTCLVSALMGQVLLPWSRVNLLTFLAVFMLIGLGGGDGFALLKIWEQEQIAGTDRLPLRLARATGRSARLTLAVMLTQCATLLSVCVSGMRPLREFGLYLVFCRALAWLLAFVLIPTLLGWIELRAGKLRRKKVQEELCEAQNAFAVVPIVPPRTGACPCSPCAGSSRGGSGARGVGNTVLFNIVGWIARRPRAVAIAGVAIAVSLVIGVAVGGRFSYSETSVFHAGHNQRTSAVLAKSFVDKGDLAAGPPDRDGVLCPVGVPSGRDLVVDEGFCTLHRCRAQNSPGASVHATGQCWVEPVGDDGGNATPPCLEMQISAKIAGAGTFLGEGEVERWAAELESLLAASRGEENTTFADLSPLMVEHWETGAVSVSPLLHITMRNVNSTGGHAKPSGRPGSSDCTLNVFCVYGGEACTLPGWQSLGVVSNSGATQISSVLSRSSPAASTDMIKVAVVFGVHTPAQTPLVGSVESPWVFDPRFEPDNPWAQRALIAMCDSTGTAEDLSVAETSCWIRSFREWVSAVASRRFPSRSFSEEFIGWYELYGGDWKQQLWVVDRRLKAMRFEFRTDVALDSDTLALLQYMGRWDSHVSSLNDLASITANKAWHTAEPWVITEAVSERRGCIESLLLSSVSFCALCVLVMTCDLLATLLLVSLGVASFCGAYCFASLAYGSELGQYEILVLVVLMGQGVGHALHVVLQSHRVAALTKEVQCQSKPGGPTFSDGGKATDTTGEAHQAVTDDRHDGLERLALAGSRARHCAVAQEAASQGGGLALITSFIFSCTCLFSALSGLHFFTKVALAMLALNIFASLFTMSVVFAVLVLRGPWQVGTFADLLQLAHTMWKRATGKG